MSSNACFSPPTIFKAHCVKELFVLCKRFLSTVHHSNTFLCPSFPFVGAWLWSEVDGKCQKCVVYLGHIHNSFGLHQIPQLTQFSLSLQLQVSIFISAQILINFFPVSLLFLCSQSLLRSRPSGSSHFQNIYFFGADV